jgi:hypothetical protein
LPGAWRHAPAADLDRTLLWLAHIVVRHEEVIETQVSFNLTGWQTEQPPSRRSRREALRLAEQLAQSARRGAVFHELARRFSEEPETALLGGSLGAVVAGHLTAWPHVLDAVAQLGPGDVSSVLETEYGYHVLQRRPPPAELEVSGSHIVIAHAAAPWLKLVARHALPQRSREEARALALELYERLRTRPDEFQGAAAEHSDHRDAVNGGDFGSWSTHEVGYSREIEALTKLDVGEVAPPLDTMIGFQILRRTEDRIRRRYAMAKLAVRFDSDLGDDDPGSSAAAAQRIAGMLARVSADPAQFDSLRQSACCRHIFEVREGRLAPDVEAAVANLAPGAIATAPIRDGNLEYLIPKRLPLEALPARLPVLFELPGAPEPR